MTGIYGFVPRMEVIQGDARRIGVSLNDYWAYHQVITDYNLNGCLLN